MVNLGEQPHPRWGGWAVGRSADYVGRRREAEDGRPVREPARRVRAAWTVARRVKGPSREEVVLTVATGKGVAVRRGLEEAR
jgi:hypothetical protein